MLDALRKWLAGPDDVEMAALDEIGDEIRRERKRAACERERATASARRWSAADGERRHRDRIGEALLAARDRECPS